MSKYIDVKYTVWGRFSFDDSTDLKPIIEHLEKEQYPEELEKFEGYLGYESMIETEEFIPIEENDNQPTIEVYENVKDTQNWQECIWDNSFESEIKRKEK
jgi:hypothetical protein